MPRRMRALPMSVETSVRDTSPVAETRTPKPPARPYAAVICGAQKSGAPPRSASKPKPTASAKRAGCATRARSTIAGGVADTGGDGHSSARLARTSSTVSTASRAAARSTLPPSTCMRSTVVIPLTRFDTQTVTRPEPGSRSRTIANAAVAARSLPALSICAMMSPSGSIGAVIVLNGAAANSPETRASALRMTSSSIGGTNTTTRPRQWGGGPEAGAAAAESASAIAISRTVPVIRKGRGYAKARRVVCAMLRVRP